MPQLSNQVVILSSDNITCTFEDGTCGFYDLVDDDFDWTRHQGSTLSTDTGPSGDHTTGTGYYMYVETSSGTINWKARLASASYVGTGNQGACLSFYYHMFGSSIGTLKVIYQTVYNTQKQEIVTLSGDHGNMWLQESVHFSSATSDWLVIFEAIRGSSYTGDIAIDDVSISQGPCPLQAEWTTPQDHTYPNEEDVVLRCASSSFQVDIPKNLIEGTYIASDFYLSGDPDNSECKGFYNGAWYISLNSSLTECGTQFNENGSQLHYQNMVEIDPSDGNSVVDFLGVEIPITCEYNSSKTLQTHFKTLNDVIRKQEKGSFEFDFAMYTDITYSARYYSYPVETKLNEELYFRAELLRSASNLEIQLRSCRATPSRDYDDAIVYEFISAG
ncbi:MAM and LDL-receptor class A domain-containing protein 2 [Holothuria leucospilota]|uniref:MAM and LDL-receptor class A domain-containing protein 2 n=1 Tax=Holothuria leucospilota TaxID=206669 RepID=A0A9Q0YHP6_HOLLE|nr:MAM and LDL-receptor class A domain-containing protein 2 [Holothuria leucospilota]